MSGTALMDGRSILTPNLQPVPSVFTARLTSRSELGDWQGSLWQDCVAAVSKLSPSHFSSFHTYAVEWNPGARATARAFVANNLQGKTFAGTLTVRSCMRSTLRPLVR